MTSVFSICLSGWLWAVLVIFTFFCLCSLVALDLHIGVWVCDSGLSFQGVKRLHVYAQISTISLSEIFAPEYRPS